MRIIRPWVTYKISTGDKYFKEVEIYKSGTDAVFVPLGRFGCCNEIFVVLAVF